jgi:hypothetical protein
MSPLEGVPQIGSGDLFVTQTWTIASMWNATEWGRVGSHDAKEWVCGAKCGCSCGSCR